MIYSRIFIPASLLHQETIAHMLIYHFNAVEKHHLAELVSEHFEERASAELRTGTSVNNNLQFYLRYLDTFDNILLMAATEWKQKAEEPLTRPAYEWQSETLLKVEQEPFAQLRSKLGWTCLFQSRHTAILLKIRYGTGSTHSVCWIETWKQIKGL